MTTRIADVNVAACDKALSSLASLLVAHLAQTNPTRHIAAMFHVSDIAVYKWLNGGVISPAYAFVIVTRARAYVPQIKHKKQREQAARLFAQVQEYIDERLA